MKLCPECGKQKLFSDFHKQKSSKDGFQSYCRRCMSNYQKEYYRIHKIKIANHQRKRCQTIIGKQIHNKTIKKYRKTLVGYLRHLFQRMKQRCNNQNLEQYKDYGGRGIKCLFETADEFIDYVVNELQIDPRGLTIDRINNNGHYKPGNIRFVTRNENNQNKRRTQ